MEGLKKIVILLLFVIITTVSGSKLKSRNGLSDLQGQRSDANPRGYDYYDANWLTTLLVICLPLIALPYVAFLLLIYSSPFPGRYGYGGYGGYGGGYGPHYGGGYGYRSAVGRSIDQQDNLLTERVVSATSAKF